MTYTDKEVTLLFALVITLAAWLLAIGSYILSQQDLADMKKKYETAVSESPFVRGPGDAR